MDISSRVRRCRMIEKINAQPDYSRRLGLECRSLAVKEAEKPFLCARQSSAAKSVVQTYES